PSDPRAVDRDEPALQAGGAVHPPRPRPRGRKGRYADAPRLPGGHGAPADVRNDAARPGLGVLRPAEDLAIGGSADLRPYRRHDRVRLVRLGSRACRPADARMAPVTRELACAEMAAKGWPREKMAAEWYARFMAAGIADALTAEAALSVAA